MSLLKPELGLQAKRPFDGPRFRQAIEELLRAAGFDIDETHLGQTAGRVERLWETRLIDGYNADLAELLGSGFEDSSQGMVLVKSIAVHGMCPHHLVPWRGVAHVAYLPGGRLHGFGRIGRLVDALAHRLTYQEWFSRDVATAMVELGGARGAACAVVTEQLCLLLGEDRRGQEQVVTTAYTGLIEDDPNLRLEFLRLIDMA